MKQEGGRGGAPIGTVGDTDVAYEPHGWVHRVSRWAPRPGRRTQTKFRPIPKHPARIC